MKYSLTTLNVCNCGLAIQKVNDLIFTYGILNIQFLF